MPQCANPAIPNRPDRLDEYLRRCESCFPTIRKDCEKKIVWYGGRRKKTAQALVYLHGFSASRMETWPLCDRLAEALGANLFYTRLRGHGQDGPAMGAARVEQWLIDGLEAVAIGSRIGGQIILVGMSTGGTLATWLAAQPSVAPLIHRLILLSPNFFPKNPLAAATMWAPSRRLLERACGGSLSVPVAGPCHERYWTVRYPLRAVGTMMQLVRLSWQVDLKNAAMPVLMLINPWDRVVNVSLALARFGSFSAPGKKWQFFSGNKDLGRHVLAGAILAPEGTDKALSILQAFLKSRP